MSFNRKFFKFFNVALVSSALAFSGLEAKANSITNSPLDGATSITTKEIQGPGSIEINRVPEYRVRVSANEGGSVDGDTNYWVEDGQSTEVVFQPDQFYTLSGVYTNGSLAGNSLTNNFSVKSPLEVNAEFEPLKTEAGTPHQWLDNFGFNPEQGDSLKTNNYTLAQHYQLDTDPTDPEGYFHTRIEPGNLILTNTSPNVIYNVDRTESLNPIVWKNYLTITDVNTNYFDVNIDLKENRKGFYRASGKRIEE